MHSIYGDGSSGNQFLIHDLLLYVGILSEAFR